jgi:ribosomal protein S18 acetylase RimI-like enzyme
VAVDAAGQISGWTWFLRRGQVLQIGALNATSADAGERLLDAVLSSSLAEEAASAIFFSFSSTPGLDRLLASRGFDVERYLYLERSTAGLAAGPEAASWRDSLREAVAVLLSASYDHTRARAFARDGGLDGWRDYVSQLVTTLGCGTFLPAGCQLVEGADGADSALQAAVLMTKIGDHTVHLPQVAVAPHARGRGLATRLVEAALGIAREAGFARATLLVGERNAGARRIYEKLGFRETAAFVSATLH